MLPSFLIFDQINLLNILKNVCFVLLVCLLQFAQRGVGICTRPATPGALGGPCRPCYKVFNSNDLMLSFYIIYLCFIFDLRRDNSKHNCAFFKL